MEAGILPTRNEGQNTLHAREPHRALLGITWETAVLSPVEQGSQFSSSMATNHCL